MQQVEEAVTLDVKDQIKLTRVLLGQRPAAFDTGGVQEDVHASATFTHLTNHLRHGIRIAQVYAAIVWCAACSPHGVDGSARRVCPLEGRQLFFYQCRRSSLAACL